MDATAAAESGAQEGEGRVVFVIGFGRRFAAAIADGLLVSLITWVLAILIGAIAVFSGAFDVGIYNAGDSDPLPISYLIVLCGILISVIYYVGHWTKSGQTLGKLLMGIRVIGADGAKVHGGTAFLRYIGYIVSAVALSLGFVWIELDRRRQGWHDKIARTLVVWDDESFSGTDAVKIEPDDPDRGRLLLAIWAIVLIVMPGALLTGLWFLGPVINNTLTDVLTGLK